MKIIYLLLGVFIVSSCVSIPIPTGNVYINEDIKNPDKALVILFRSSKKHLRTPTVYVDGEKLTRLGSEMYTSIELSPGMHQFETRGGMVGESRDFKIDVKANKKYYIRWLGIDSTVRTGDSLMPVASIITWQFETTQEHDALNFLKKCYKILKQSSN